MLRNLFARFWTRGPAGLPTGCGHVQSRMLPYLDHELDPIERSLVEGHIAQCAACRAEMAAFRQTESVLGAASATIPSPGDLRAEFYSRLEQSRRRPKAAPWILAGPALAGVVGLLFLAGRFATGPRPLQTITQAAPSLSARLSVSSGGSRQGESRQIARDDSEPHATRPQSILRSRPMQRLRRPRAYSSELAAARPVRRRLDVTNRLIDSPDKRRTLLVASIAPRAASAAYRSRTDVYMLSASRHYSDSTTWKLPAGTTESYQDSEAAGRRKAGVALTSLITELHVSDEDRDFMSSSHLNTAAAHGDRVETLRVDDDNESAQEPVELPALP